ncbi:MAG: hypothetical protein AABW57_01150 [Nanoarchaeota archaeon]
MRLLKLFFLFLIFIFLINVVNAAEVSFKSTPVQDVILPGKAAIFNVEISNLGPTGEVKAIITDFNWRKESNYGFYTIDSGRTIQDTFKLYPIGSLAPGKYSVNVRVYATRNPEDFVDYSFIVSNVPYKDLVDAKLDYNPQGLSPNRENLVTLKLRNRHAIEVKDLDIKVRSEILDQDFITSLGKEEIKDFPFSLSLGNVKEGDYEFNIMGLFENNIVINSTLPIKVASYSDVKETRKEGFSFLVKSLEIIRMNNGNSVSKEIYTKEISSFERLFTKVTPEPSNVEKLDGAYRYTWQFSLNPNDSYFILIKTNYGTPILILILLGLIIYLVYRRTGAGLRVTKKVLLLKSKEGHIAGLKVLLILKNHGNVLKNIRLTDNIPGLLELPHEYGTLKPSSTRSGVAGSIVVWEIPELIKGEERVIAYKMKSKVTGLGRLTIPRALCRYKDSSGKLYIVRSNQFNLF